MLSVAQTMARSHEVWLICRDHDVRKLAMRLAPEFENRLVVLADLRKPIPAADLVRRARELESAYGFTFSMLMSFDRGVGQGYLYNADRHPLVTRSLRGYEDKLQEHVALFSAQEAAYKAVNPDLIFCWDRLVQLSLMAKANGVPMAHIANARVGSRYILAENDQAGKGRLDEALARALEGEAPEQDVEYRPYDKFLKDMAELHFSYADALKESARIFVNEMRKLVRRGPDKGGYVFCGWIPSRLRRVRSFRYCERYGADPKDIPAGMRAVYFPLHMEPEVTLMQYSPEFNNSLEAIAWISKSLPADTLLVVKENPWSYGVRSMEYYQRLRKIPNVVISRPNVPSPAWIERSDFIVALTGTVAYESVYASKPVVSFGKHQLVNGLPVVEYVDSFATAAAAVERFLADPPPEAAFRHSRHALDRAVRECSFELPGFVNLYRATTLSPELGAILADRLEEEFPVALAGKEGAA